MKVQVSNTNTPNWRDITVKSQVPTDLKCLEILAKTYGGHGIMKP